MERRRFCTRCGTQLESDAGGCPNVECSEYRAPVTVATPEPVLAASNGPPGAPDVFAEPLSPTTPLGAEVRQAATPPHELSEPEILPPAMALDRDWIAAGEAGQNEVYLGYRLAFQPPEAILNGSPEIKILQAAAARFFVLGFFVFVIGIVVSIVFAFLSGPKTGLLLFLLINFAFFILQLLLPARVPISEWMLLLDDKGAAAESAFAQITDAFRRRQSPTTPTARRVSFRGPAGVGAFASNTPPARNYLAVKYGHVIGYISAFAFGNDLYIGWTLWWRQRPIRSIWNYVRQLIAAALGRDVQFQLTLRADDAKALRELMHSAAREGVDVASRGLTISLAGTVGADVPVEDFQAAFEE